MIRSVHPGPQKSAQPTGRTGRHPWPPPATDVRAGLLVGAAVLCVASRRDFFVVAALLAVAGGVAAVRFGWLGHPGGGWHWGAAVALGSVAASLVVALVVAAGVAAARMWMRRRRPDPVGC